MHTLFLSRGYHFGPKVSRNLVRRSLPFLNHTRHYARRNPNPAFDANPSSPPGTRNKYKPTAEKTEVKEPKRFKFPTGRIIFITVIAYIGYNVYKWQTNPHRSHTLNPQFFSPFILQAREQVSPTSIVLNLLSLPQGQNIENVSEARRRGVWSVQVMQPELQIARSYTPLPPSNGSPAEQLRLFVRRDPQGEVSRFLHRISPGTLVHLRGPHMEYEIPEDIDEILFLAGGTGIAPALQVAYSVFTARGLPVEKLPKMRILWANRRREDALAGPKDPALGQFEAELAAKIQEAKNIKERTEDIASGLPELPRARLVEDVEQLQLRYDGKVTVEYFIDGEGSFITEPILREYLAGLGQKSETGPPPRKQLLLISGPEGFVNVYAGPKEWRGGKEISGPLGGLLKKIDPKDWEICKL